ncbi:MAG TPA: hypothetical protein VGM51_01770 [Armatimonadota bacterium]
MTATGFYEAPATYYHSPVRITTEAGSFEGSLRQTTSRWGALAGGRWVHGLVWRVHVGAEVGWSHQAFSNLDLVNVADKSNPHSFGLGLKDTSRDSLVVAPLVGLEWQAGDHWSVAVTPRAEMLMGADRQVVFIVPVSLGYEWFVF